MYDVIIELYDYASLMVEQPSWYKQMSPIHIFLDDGERMTFREIFDMHIYEDRIVQFSSSNCVSFK